MSATLCLVDALPAGAAEGLPPSLLERRRSQARAMAAAGGRLLALEYRQAFDADALPAADAYKFDAPGQNEALDHWLLQLGGGPLRAREPGEIHARTAWFEGYERALHAIAAKAPRARWLNPVADILGMGDKLACQQRLAARGVCVPALLGEFASFAELAEGMRASGCERVFVKPRFGSSGSGVIALRRARGRWQATSGLVLREGRPGNSLQVRREHAPARIAALVDALLSATPCYAEHWLPKPRLPGTSTAWDLRVVAWRGRARQRVARVAAHPICNLHLGARRLAPDWLSGAQLAAVDACVAAIARAFADAAIFGADLVLHGTRASVLEVNAFGDHLNGVLREGRSSHEDQALALCDEARLARCA